METVSASKARPAKTEQRPVHLHRKQKPAPYDMRPAEHPWTSSVEFEEPDLPDDGDEPAEIEEELPEY
jgi:hypothetical protein